MIEDRRAAAGPRLGLPLSAPDVRSWTPCRTLPDQCAPTRRNRKRYARPRSSFRSRTTFSFIGVVGIQRPIGNGRLGFEAAGGARIAAYFLDSRYHDTSTTSAHRGSAPLLETRASYEHWVSPRISAGVTVGKSVIERGSWMGGLHVGFHGRTFGGSR